MRHGKSLCQNSKLKETLDAVGPRLRALRQQRETTLADLSAATGISVSTLSRLESGSRRPTLELLLPLARAHGVTLDELVDAPPTGDPRIHLKPIRKFGMTMLPLKSMTEQTYSSPCLQTWNPPRGSSTVELAKFLSNMRPNCCFLLSSGL